MDTQSFKDNIVIVILTFSLKLKYSPSPENEIIFLEEIVAKRLY